MHIEGLDGMGNTIMMVYFECGLIFIKSLIERQVLLQTISIILQLYECCESNTELNIMLPCVSSIPVIKTLTP